VAIRRRERKAYMALIISFMAHSTMKPTSPW
jgi:hypothetical protein